MDQLKYVIDRTALGSMASLGDLYDARNDTFLNISIFKNPPPPSSIDSTGSPKTDIDHINTESFAEKVSRYNLTAGLTIKLLSGLLGSVEGSGKYLSNESSTTKVARSTMMYSIMTKVELLKIYDEQLQSCISEQALLSASDEECGATHIVVRIDWGAKVVITVEDNTESGGSQTESKLKLGGQLSKLFSQLDVGAHVARDNETKIDNQLKSYSVKLYGDIMPKSGAGWDQVQNLMSNISTLLQEANQGKGRPVTYGLIPISVIQNIFNVRKSTFVWIQIDKDIVSSFVTVFDKIKNLKGDMTEFLDEMEALKGWLSDTDKKTANAINEALEEADLKFKLELKTTFLAVQKGTLPIETLEKLRSKYAVQNCEDFRKAEEFVTNRGHEIGFYMSRARLFVANKIEFLERGKSIDTAAQESKGFRRTYIFICGKDIDILKPSKLYSETVTFFVDLAKLSLHSAIKHGSKEEETPRFVFVDGRIHTNLPLEDVTVHYSRGNYLQSRDYFGDYSTIPIVGRYKLVDNGAYEEILIATGFGWFQRKAILASHMTVKISEDDGRYTVEIMTSVGTVSNKFRLNEPFQEVTADGMSADSLVTREGTSLIHVQNLTNPGDQDPRRLIVRTFTKKEMTVHITANRARATRLFKRV